MLCSRTHELDRAASHVFEPFWILLAIIHIQRHRQKHTWSRVALAHACMGVIFLPLLGTPLNQLATKFTTLIGCINAERFEYQLLTREVSNWNAQYGFVCWEILAPAGLRAQLSCEAWEASEPESFQHADSTCPSQGRVSVCAVEDGNFVPFNLDCVYQRCLYH